MPELSCVKRSLLRRFQSRLLLQTAPGSDQWAEVLVTMRVTESLAKSSPTNSTSSQRNLLPTYLSRVYRIVVRPPLRSILTFSLFHNAQCITRLDISPLVTLRCLYCAIIPSIELAIMLYGQLSPRPWMPSRRYHIIFKAAENLIVNSSVSLMKENSVKSTENCLSNYLLRTRGQVPLPSRGTNRVRSTRCRPLVTNCVLFFTQKSQNYLLLTAFYREHYDGSPCGTIKF